MALLELRLANDEIVRVEEHEKTSISTQDNLESVFGGTAIIGADLTKTEFDVPVGTIEKGFIRIMGAEWKFNDGNFESYVCNLMNEQGIDGVFGILEGGIYSGYTDLIWNTKAIDLFVEHIREIEISISELVLEIGAEILIDNSGNFNLARLAVMVVENMMRNKVQGVIEY